MPSARGVTSASTRTGGSRTPTSTGSWRPGEGRRPWDFVLTTDRVQLEALASVWRGARHLPGAAAAIVLTLRQPDPERYRLMDQYDLGQATMAMALAAVDLGIGSGHSAIGDEDACRRILSIPAEQICAYMLALGYPADRPLTPIRTPDRRPLEDVVHRGGW